MRHRSMETANVKISEKPAAHLHNVKSINKINNPKAALL